jgi:hypothetical protein
VITFDCREEVIKNFKGVNIMGNLINLANISRFRNEDQYIDGDASRQHCEKRALALAKLDGHENDREDDEGVIRIEDEVCIGRSTYIKGEMHFEAGGDPLETLDRMECKEFVYPYGYPDACPGVPITCKENEFSVKRTPDYVEVSTNREDFLPTRFMIDDDGFHDYSKLIQQ